jgi:hypothetical protein
MTIHAQRRSIECIVDASEQEEAKVLAGLHSEASQAL